MCPERTNRVFRREHCYEIFDFQDKCTECVKKGGVFCEDEDSKKCYSGEIISEINKYCTDYT